MIAAIPFLVGLVFALGLGLSGMTMPSKVIGFLDVTGAWDPSLAFVMGGAVTVFAVIYRLARRRRAPLFGGSFAEPPRAIDRKLLLGAAIFGVGWGLSGVCPGPGFVSLASGAWAPVIFVASMFAGMAIVRGAGE